MNFKEGVWSREINTRDFIVRNYTPYDGDESFLCDPSDRTRKLWQQVCDLMQQETVS